MKKKMTLQKATLAVGVVAMSVGLFNSFNAEADGGCEYGYMCCPGDSYCTDESGIVWTEDKQVQRRFQGDVCH